jgi:hypothetical protein
MSEVKRQRRRPQAKSTPRQSERLDEVVPLTHRRVFRVLKTVVAALAAVAMFCITVATFYYAYWYEKSALIVQIDRAWLEADVLTDLNALVARGTLDVSFIFSNNGNRPVFIQSVSWKIRSIYADDPEGCDIGMETTEPLFGEEKIFDTFPLNVAAGDFETVDLKLPFSVPLAIVERGTSVHSCFTFEFSGFLNTRFRRSINAVEFDVDESDGRASISSFSMQKERLL